LLRIVNGNFVRNVGLRVECHRTKKREDHAMQALFGFFMLVALLPIVGGALLWIERTCKHLRAGR